jgi:hypothetical protein
MSDHEYYKTLPLEELGLQGCCKVFCRAYLEIEPAAKLWGVRRMDSSLAHVFVVHGGLAYDIRGAHKIEDIADDSSERVSKIDMSDFDSMTTFADSDPILNEVAACRFADELRARPQKYGLHKMVRKTDG